MRLLRRALLPILSVRVCSGLMEKKLTEAVSVISVEISGNGIIAKVDGREIAIGNDKLMKHMGISLLTVIPWEPFLHMAVDHKYAGHIVISDVVKPHSKEAVQELKKAGIRKTVMLTGDAKKVAEQVAEDLGLDGVYSELLPADKVRK